LDRTLAEKMVASRGWLSKQPEKFRNALLKRAHLLTFPTGASVFHAGDDPGGIYGAVGGGILVYVPGLDGRERLAHVVRPGVWFGHGPALAHDERTLTFVAGEPSLALHVPLAVIDELAATDAVSERSIRAITEFTMRIAYATVADLLVRRSDCRIAATLLRVCAALDGVKAVDPAGFILKQTQLAEMANVSRHLANQTLTKFEARGWIVVSYNHVKITDPNALLTFIGREAERTK
jgi:CRP/FNR family cyclic AMP-dependent transcriptional regulator